ncbi:D-3-phosphoglycerate dehydrogenase [Candidatus Syntrophocurvum alkaliphilum]|uniref:D-3-phosphoglycerate dehydrogenase n=1 Tax=Candidatus Syntrophocurvum alkaliphilum TaxID=2293317 RepID=A0A6I6DL60_9FIRM|nr:phosphoglycerate dehydrogenase [Candidatus Syntrophocurvum alkaliphilum]QGU00600.1 D-3-phosphoglycerate dehydrogenase [Candidatus Syntrophocurvum alkaliphilum]
MAKKRVIVSERISEEGLNLLRSELEVDFRDGISRQELLEVIDQYDALIVRSVTKVNEELISRGKNLRFVGRAGNGVDNIDVDVCTRYGVVVANTPDSNTISAAEQTISLLLSSVRNTAWANTTLKGGTWDRKPFRGMELFEKTVGIVGLGRIGSMVATRLKSFNMKVLAYDPYISDERFERFGTEKVNSLEELVKNVDIITVHTPRNEETMHMIDEKILDMAKDGVRVVNCARGGIIKEEALVQALESGKVASAGLDVFEKEPATQNPLFEFNNVVVTPHLGADTYEAQKRVGENIAEQAIKALNGDIVPNVVNLPTMLSEELDYLKPYITLAEKMGKFYYQIEKTPVNRVEITYSGPISKNETEMLTIALLKGILEPVMWEKVNFVNARLMAEERGIKIFEQKEEQSPKRYKNLITIKLVNSNQELEIAGTLSRARSPLLVEINGYETESALEGYVILAENEDRPRVIGPFATALGDVGVNIASMRVARQTKGETAIMLINVDNKVEEEVLDKVSKSDGIKRAKLLKF